MGFSPQRRNRKSDQLSHCAHKVSKSIPNRAVHQQCRWNMGRNRRALREEEEEHSNACHGNRTSRTVTITAMFRVFITIATERMNGGTIQWNSLILMITIQQQTYTLLSRCATFFPGVSIPSFQISVAITRKPVPYGMDLAGMFPRYLPRMRAYLILVILTFIAQPWIFLSQKLIFLNILSVFVRRYPFIYFKIGN